MAGCCFGVGAGWLKEQLEVMGADYPHRLAELKDHLAAIRALWADPQGSYDGRWASFPPLKLNPRPAREGGPPVHMGTWGPKAVKRVPSWGVDVWLPMLVSPEDLKVELGKLGEECERHGRDAALIEVTLFEYDPGGDRAAAQAFLERYAEAGADRVVLIEGMGESMGAHAAAEWSPGTFRARLEEVASRYL